MSNIAIDIGWYTFMCISLGLSVGALVSVLLIVELRKYN